jgi:hypothetical protein
LPRFGEGFALKFRRAPGSRKTFGVYPTAQEKAKITEALKAEGIDATLVHYEGDKFYGWDMGFYLLANGREHQSHDAYNQYQTVVEALKQYPPAEGPAKEILAPDNVRQSGITLVLQKALDAKAAAHGEKKTSWWGPLFNPPLFAWPSFPKPQEITIPFTVDEEGAHLDNLPEVVANIKAAALGGKS